MTLVLDSLLYQYELRRLVQMFFPEQTVAVSNVVPASEDYISVQDDEGQFCVRLRLRGFLDSASEEHPPALDQTGTERQVGRMMCRMLSKRTGIVLPWGILTGVRPVRLLTRHLAGRTVEAVREEWQNELLVSEEKFRFARQVAETEAEALKLSTSDSFSLYLGIPFCPTRCSYCSFVSHAVEKSLHLMEPYVDTLCKEAKLTGLIARELGLKLRTIYIGGGTPTALSPQQLERVMQAVLEHFDVASALEYTVEAGRPDTVTKEKLAIIKSLGGGRISINPQSLQEPVLAAVGRQHTVKQVYEAYALAADCGFDAINMDLIAGLPGDTPQGFKDSLDRVIALSPANVTVHTLSVKRAADLSYEAAAQMVGRVTEMTAYSQRALPKEGYLPYYLYRQSGMLSNLENVGYCKPGAQGLYNIYSMAETHTILALGSGGASKLVGNGGKTIKRFYNFKHPQEYLADFDETVNRKKEIIKFYKKSSG